MKKISQSSKKISKLSTSSYLSMPWHYCSEASEWEGAKGFWVWVAELPDCSTFATSLENGLAQLPALLDQYLRVAIASKAKIPLPEVPRRGSSQFAGRLLLRVPASLHMGIKTAAKQERVSINQFALKVLTEAVTKSTAPAELRS